MARWILCLWLLLASSVFAANKAILLTIDGAIGPATQDYIHRGIDYAKAQDAKVIILQINTPGGLASSLRGINQDIISSTVPVIAYVAPSGARAASAGTFLVYASHLSAMAPGTNIGSATPVNLMATSDKKSPEQAKAMNDSVAYIRSLAELRGKNAEWAEKAVREAANISADQAKRLQVIDHIAPDYPSLLKQIDGKSVAVNEILHKIDTKNIEIEKYTPDWRYDFLSFITNPNVAYILLLIAFYGLFFEFSSPGAIIPGVVGLISLLLVLYAFQLMPVNYTGLALVFVGIAFMLFEVYSSSFGILGIGGAIAFIIGSILLFDVNDPNYKLTLRIIGLMSMVTIAFFFILISLAYRSQKQAVVSGREALIGSEGIVLSSKGENVIVRVAGEIWEAQATEKLKTGDKVRVTEIEGLKLTVQPENTKDIL